MSEFTSKDQPNFGSIDYTDGEPRPANKVVLKLPGIPGPDNTVQIADDVQQGQSANASPNKEGITHYQLFVQKEGSWSMFEAASNEPIESSTVQDMGNIAHISINGGTPVDAPATPSGPPGE